MAFSSVSKEEKQAMHWHVLWSRLEEQWMSRTLPIVFFWTKKAFDTLDHGILLQKLEFLGSEDQCWICPPPTWQRSQYTSIKGVNSQLREMKCGVPQGSVLGPLLFLLYVNDICDNVKSPLTLFPDDTNIFEDLRPGNHKLKRIIDWRRRCHHSRFHDGRYLCCGYEGMPCSWSGEFPTPLEYYR